jgi:hypothetical protein
VAAQLAKDLGLTAELVVGNSGELTVWVDGDKVADKATTGAFPIPADVVAAIRQRS